MPPEIISLRYVAGLKLGRLQEEAITLKFRHLLARRSIIDCMLKEVVKKSRKSDLIPGERSIVVGSIIISGPPPVDLRLM
jgi:hypothetical protein